MAVRNPERERFGAVWQNPHAEGRWQLRAGGRRGENLLARWGEAVPVEAPQASEDHADARAHVPTDTLLIARWGEIQTVLAIAQFPEHVQSEIRGQL